MDAARPHDEASPVASFWRPILHRWFVEYNPLYLLSAALVLAGTILVTRGLAEQESALGSLGVTAIAELYSVTLIGGAALLMRLGQRRSAVMLALLAMFYQCDLTLHTTSCPDLGWVGGLAAGAWLALFGAKLAALGWAMKLRFSRSLVAATMGGGVGLATLPYTLQALSPRAAGGLVMVWLLALSTLQLSATVTSALDLDRWGQTVLRRATRVTWAIFATLLAFHVSFWSFQGRLDLGSLVPVIPLILTHRIRSDRAVGAAVGATLLATAALVPAAFSITALLAAAIFGLRALRARRPGGVVSSRQATGAVPYRAGGEQESVAVEASEEGLEARTWLIGAALSAYLSIWTAGWSGGSWPEHLVALDLILTAAAMVAMWLGRAPLGLAPLALVWGHFVWHGRLIPAPRSTLQWGGSAIVLGFTLLLVSLAASYLLKPPGRPEPSGR